MDLAQYFIGNMEHQLQTDHLGQAENNTNSLHEYDSIQQQQSLYDSRVQASTMHPEISEPFHKCPICGNIYDTEHGMRQHMNIQHKEKTFICSICKKGCNTEKSLEIHMRIHKEDKCLLCPYCGLKFAGRYSLRRHIQRHVDVKRFQCNVCKKMLKSKLSLQKHLADHDNKELLPCSSCQKSFSSSAKLALHIRRSHSTGKPHACSLCGKRFFSRSDLKDHSKIHYSDDGVTLLQCANCGKFFDRKSNLETHMKSHEGKKTHKCPVCNKEYAHSWGLKEHMYAHSSNSPFECNICGKLLKNYSTYRYHKTTHMKEKNFKCSLCGKQFFAKSGYEKHMQMHQRQAQAAEIVPDSTAILELLNEDEVDTEGKVLCTQCGKWLKKTSVRGHMEAHKRRKSDKKFQCVTCLKYFFTSRGLDLHTQHYCLVKKANQEAADNSIDGGRTNLNDNSAVNNQVDMNDTAQSENGQTNVRPNKTPSTCVAGSVKDDVIDIGDGDREEHSRPTKGVGAKDTNAKKKLHTNTEDLVTGNSLSAREQNGLEKEGKEWQPEPQTEVNNLTGDRPHECMLCKLTFKKKNDLWSHFQSHGALVSKDNLQCLQCGKTSDGPRNYITHMKSHLGQKTFECWVCFKEYVSKQGLKEHVLSTHVDDNPYKCDICGKQMKYDSSLRHHKKRHDEEKCIKCSVCGKQFDRKVRLELHMRTHDGTMETFDCAQCGKSFVSKKNLTTHLRAHSGLTTHKCPVCNREYTRYSSLKKHMQSHMKDKSDKWEIDEKSVSKKSTHNGSLICPECGRRCRNEKSLLSHRCLKQSTKRHHGEAILKKYVKKASKKSKDPELADDREDSELSDTQTDLTDDEGSTMTECSVKFMEDPITKLKHQRKPKRKTKQTNSTEEGTEDFSHPKVTEEIDMRSDNEEQTENQYLTVSPRTSDCRQGHKEADKGELAVVNSFSYTEHDNDQSSLEDLTDCSNVDKSEIQGKSQGATGQCENSSSNDSQSEDHSSEHGDGKFEISNSPAHQAAKSTGLDNTDKTSHGDSLSAVCNEREANYRDLTLQQAGKDEDQLEESQSDNEVPVNDPSSSDRRHKGQHQCPVCKLTFSDQNAQQSHLITHTDVTIQCAECGKSFHNRRNLDTHMKIHAGIKTYECKICHKEYGSPQSLSQHKLLHKKMHYFICPFCGKQCNSYSGFKYHKNTHRDKGNFPCIVCKMKFTCKASLKRHIIRKHQSDNIKDAIEPVTYSLSGNQSTGGPEMKAIDSLDTSINVATSANYITSQSDFLKSAKNNGVLKQTVLSDLDAENGEETNEGAAVSTSTCQVERSEMDIKSQKDCGRSYTAKSRSRPHLCSVCGLTCPTPSDLKRHFVKHTGERGHQCDICGKSFKHGEYLKSHIERHSEKTFQCSICNKLYAGEKLLALHMKVVHTNKRYQCKFCDKVYKYKDSLTDHEKTHLQADAYAHACMVCGKVLESPCNLKTHMRSHEGKKTYECPICHKEYVHSWGLKGHMFSHCENNPFKCPICGKQLKNDSSYRYHKRTHETEKRFNCTVCLRGYNNKKSLEKHKCIGVPDV